jgi:lipoic acid synthetase
MNYLRKPDWIKIRPADSAGYRFLKEQVKHFGLSTVCQEAACPNIAECWKKKGLTVMILGDTCTRNCRFCNVKTAAHPSPPDPQEPEKTATLLAPLQLKHVVITVVNRDDMPDGGSDHIARTISEIRKSCPEMRIEILVGDFEGSMESLARIAQEPPDVFAHNIETVERLTPGFRDPRASYRRSLNTLKNYRSLKPDALTKSSMMLGLGESRSEITAAFSDLRQAGVELLTLGQYLQPSRRHVPVVRYVEPFEFNELADIARQMGFLGVASGPLVRSSYNATELYESAINCKNPLP